MCTGTVAGMSACRTAITSTTSWEAVSITRTATTATITAPWKWSIRGRSRTAMSSQWRPAPARLFDLWLLPPAGGGHENRIEALGNSARKRGAAPWQTEPPEASSRGAGQRQEPSSGSAGALELDSASGGRVVRIDARGWTVAAAVREPAVGVAVEWEQIPTPPQRLHPAERRRLERMPPGERAAARKLLAAARRALAAALGIPAGGVCHAADLGPLLDGAQALRAGGWSVQRVPAPPGVYVFLAAPGWGWGYAQRSGGPPEGTGPE